MLRNFVKWRAIMVCILMIMSLSGCGPLLFGTLASGALYLVQERSAGAVIDDFTMWASIKNRLLQCEGADFVDVSVDVVDARVMLTGMVKNPRLRLLAAKVAWEQEGVKEVINEVQLYGDTSYSKVHARDIALNAQVKTKLLMTKNIRSINYVVETVGGVVYLFGIAHDRDELEIVTDVASRIRGVRKVVAHVKLRKDTRHVVAVTRDGVDRDDGGFDLIDADNLWT